MSVFLSSLGIRLKQKRLPQSLRQPSFSYYIKSLCMFSLFCFRCVGVWKFPSAHPLSSNLLRRVRLFSVECYPMHSFLPFSFLLLSVLNLTLRLSVAASCIYWSFYLYLSALSLSSCLETFVGGLLLSLQPVLLLCYPQSYLC